MTDTLSLERVAEIRALAEKVTPGPWIRAGVRHKIGQESCFAVGPDVNPIAFLPIGSQQRDRFHAEAFKDAAYIAALDPQTVLALLASHEALRAEVERLQDQLSVCRKAGEMLSGAIVSSEDQREAALDRIWDSINAHGGTFEADDLEGKGKCEMIDVALEIIEREGGIGEVRRRLLQTEVEAADE